MTTFTMQDLNALPTTPEEDEAMEALAKLGAGVDLKEVLFDYENAPEVPRETREAVQAVVQNIGFVGEGKTNVFGTDVPDPTLTDIVNNICAQLQLLATVISEARAQPNTTPPEEAQGITLQETVSLTLQQADWFKDMVRRELIGGGIEDLAKNAVEEVVENEVEHYFSHRFDPSDHFDFNDAVQDAVSDQIDDVVADKIAEAVEEYMENATITISK